MIRSFCFTENNYTEEHIKILRTFERANYILFGKEVGESGTPHLQGYIELKSQMRLTTIKKTFPTMHIESRRGTQIQAMDYCKKDKEYEEIGEPKKQGARQDLDKCRTLALESGMREVSAQCNMQQIRVAEIFLTYNETERDFKPKVIWITGESGSGKSRLAREMCNEDTYTKNSETKWFSGYDAHECLILDDFRDSWWHMTYLLGLIDRYGFQVETKGGQRQMLAKTIIITSIKHPKDCYQMSKEPNEQLLRRIDEIMTLSTSVSDVSEVGEVILDSPPNIE